MIGERLGRPTPTFMSRLSLGLLAGVVYGALSAASMLPLEFPDKRAALLAITDEGRRRLAEVSTQRREKVEAMLHDWTDAELEDFVRTLARYNTALEQ